MHPVLGQIGPVTILTHDAFTVLALAVGLSIYYRELARRGWLETRIVWISLAAVLAGAIGARTITAWEHLEYYIALEGVPLSLAIEHSGKSLIGALAGGYLGTVLAKRAFGYTRSTGDCYVLAIPVATAIGRIGCFLSELPLGTLSTTTRSARSPTTRSTPTTSRVSPSSRSSAPAGRIRSTRCDG